MDLKRMIRVQPKCSQVQLNPATLSVKAIEINYDDDGV